MGPELINRVKRPSVGIGYLSYHFPQTVFFIYRSPTNTVMKAPAAMRTIPNKISHSDREPSFDTSPVLIKIAIGDEITRPKIAQNVCTPYFSKRNVISFAIRKIQRTTPIPNGARSRIPSFILARSKVRRLSRNVLIVLMIA